MKLNLENFLLFLLIFIQAYSSRKEDPELSPRERKLILGSSVSKEPVSVIPWKLILSKAPVWALIISRFCHNWGTFVLLTWMPTYYSQSSQQIKNCFHTSFEIHLTESGLLCVLPWLTMAVLANVGGWIADTLVSRGLSITAVRKARIKYLIRFNQLKAVLIQVKEHAFHFFAIISAAWFSSSQVMVALQNLLLSQIMQSIGFLGPAFFLTQLSHVRTPAMAVLSMACTQGVLLGLSNTAGVLAGVFGTAATGYILQRGSWPDVFKVAVALYIIGTLVWNFFSTGEKVLD
ncbi:hypothetical protein POTOM_008400 [Populus tomentosa]|uniref:Uncharacterized protein n=1 Tax=Populus tomentosa TaxID=118781 RepID=A0A8X8DE45_POPTO|nr:hypothetical protein POTOM_008400 [Populus tomentosa]